jgi:hypothetical protein
LCAIRNANGLDIATFCFAGGRLVTPTHADGLLDQSPIARSMEISVNESREIVRWRRWGLSENQCLYVIPFVEFKLSLILYHPFDRQFVFHIVKADLFHRR